MRNLLQVTLLLSIHFLTIEKRKYILKFTLLLFSEQPTITPIKVFPYNLREPVSISCEARGFPVPNVTWFNPDGSPVPSSMVINRGSSQDSQTTSLVISGVIVSLKFKY